MSELSSDLTHLIGAISPRFQEVFERPPYDTLGKSESYVDKLLIDRNNIFLALFEKTDESERRNLIKSFKDNNFQLHFDAYTIAQTAIHHTGKNIEEIMKNVNRTLQKPWRKLFNIAIMLQNAYPEDAELQKLLMFSPSGFFRRDRQATSVDLHHIVPDDIDILHGSYQVPPLAYELVDRITNYFTTHKDHNLDLLRTEAKSIFNPSNL